MGTIDLHLPVEPVMPKRKDYRIGCIGSGFIMRDCHLVAYRDAGFNPYAISSRTFDNAKAAAELRQIPVVYRTWEELIGDPRIEILDIAIPPDRQLEVVRRAVKQDHIKGILCQKPLAMNARDAHEIVELCEGAGIKIAVNSNMRYDQSMRALKTILDRGYLGEPVLATIEMRAIPHWQEFLHTYSPSKSSIWEYITSIFSVICSEIRRKSPRLRAGTPGRRSRILTGSRSTRSTMPMSC
ncbi:Gfo/Idh/MocA family protein [Paenibacillus mucilaginosus]|uniref:Gfo/Idh/MocA family protein n=1 Tax=Paenibacillus mucilaginosus TaxID=61624 RepID=UPI0002DF71C2|nr:Gfo/Idh/MocA family oxidoreductase [Paenibacillus mucilaginosus]